jgi:hypothetical protein
MGFLRAYGRERIEHAPDNNFIRFQIGDNEAKIKSVEERTSKAGNDMLVVTYILPDGAEIKEFITDNGTAATKIKQLQKAFGIPWGEQNIRNWIGKKAIVVCKEDEYNGNIYPKVSYYKPLEPRDNIGGSYSNSYNQSKPAREECVEYPAFTNDIPF